MGRFKDQVIMLLILILGGCKLLVSSPSCTAWSSNSRGWKQDKLEHERNMETKPLQFLTLMCMIQWLIGKSFLVENPKGSDIFKSSCLTELLTTDLSAYRHELDQCMFVGKLHGQEIKKPTGMLGNKYYQKLERKCCGTHRHLVLRGGDRNGALTAQAAVYPTELCDTLVQIAVKTECQDGVDLEGIKGEVLEKLLKDDSSYGEVVMIALQRLGGMAKQRGLSRTWGSTAGPWMAQHAALHRVVPQDVHDAGQNLGDAKEELSTRPARLWAADSGDCRASSHHRQAEGKVSTQSARLRVADSEETEPNARAISEVVADRFAEIVGDRVADGCGNGVFVESGASGNLGIQGWGETSRRPTGMLRPQTCMRSSSTDPAGGGAVCVCMHPCSTCTQRWL